MSYAETYDGLCVLLEEYADADIETIASQILAFFGLFGEDLLEALDPPTGLATWLHSHGLSLMVTREAPAPRVWDAIEEDDEEEGEEEGDLEGVGETSPLQVGEYIEYRTAPQGRDHVQQIGAGYVMEVLEYGIWVKVPGLLAPVFVEPKTDFIRRVPGPADEQTAPALPEGTVSDARS